MYLSKTFHIKLYDTSIQFIVSDNVSAVHNRIANHHKTNDVWDKDESPAGFTYCISMSKYYMVINSKYISYNTICHELLHCVYGIAFDRGIHEEEARAWIQGIVANEIFKFLHKKKVSITYN